MDENYLYLRLQERSANHAFRSLRPDGNYIDYCSNDYLGIVKLNTIEEFLKGNIFPHGSTGSRLLTGNNKMIEEVEMEIATFHDAPAALVFNSGYDANFGLLACIAKRRDLILYDKLSHASIRDGIRQSFADSHSFAHNDLNDLEKKLQNHQTTKGSTLFVVTESVFSMDGDIAPMVEIVNLCDRYNANLIVDEAHATGVIGENGEGVVQHLGLQKRCFARVHTFGKALGCHGAAILGSNTLRDFLINFCRPFIYSTAIPPFSVAAIRATYKIFPGMNTERATLKNLISLFDYSGFKKSNTPIQCVILPGNDNVKIAAKFLLENNLDARPILYPTVPLGEERIRIALHSFNTVEETKLLIDVLSESLTVDR